VSNNNGNMARIKARISELESRAARPAHEEIVLGDTTIDEHDNRTRIHFPCKPAPDVIVELKSYGFRWCRSDACWQRMASPQAELTARAIVERAQRNATAA
jgi:hypothetical protein